MNHNFITKKEVGKNVTVQQKTTPKLVRGFTLLVAIVTTAMLLLISFVVSNIALKQLELSYAAEESQYAFYAADTGTECAFYWDTKATTTSKSAFSTTTASFVNCSGQSITTDNQTVRTVPPVQSLIGGGGNSNPTSIFQLNMSGGCAIVRVTKNANYTTTIDSRGYNTCTVNTVRRFERGVTITY